MAIKTLVTPILEELHSRVSGINLEALTDRIKGFTPKLPSLRIGDLEVAKPIIQGGMGVGISLSSLASCVANEGGIGVIAANGIGLLEKDYYQDGQAANIRAFRKEIQKARSLTKGVLGVNIMVALQDYLTLLDVAIEENVDIVFLGAGLPIKNLPIEKIRKHNIKVAPIVSSARAITMIATMWKKIYNDLPDCFVLEGPLAGGHLGFSEEQINDPSFKLENLTVQCVKELKALEKKIPLIVAGGIYTGSDIHRFLKLGAQGAQMGTRFVATKECDASDIFKEAYLKAKKSDIGLINSPVGLLGRAIKNTFLLDAEEGKRPSFKCGWKCLASCKAEEAHYCISTALNNARRGFLNSGFVFAGTNAYKIKKVVTVEELVQELEVGYKRSVLKTLGGILTKLNSYLEAQQIVSNLSKMYEEALIKGDEPIKQIKNQYRKATSTLERMRLSLIESLSNGVMGVA